MDIRDPAIALARHRPGDHQRISFRQLLSNREHHLPALICIYRSSHDFILEDKESTREYRRYTGLKPAQEFKRVVFLPCRFRMVRYSASWCIYCTQTQSIWIRSAFKQKLFDRRDGMSISAIWHRNMCLRQAIISFKLASTQMTSNRMQTRVLW